MGIASPSNIEYSRRYGSSAEIARATKPAEIVGIVFDHPERDDGTAIRVRAEHFDDECIVATNGMVFDVKGWARRA